MLASMLYVTCAGCCSNFKTQPALTTHIQQQQDCNNFYKSAVHIKSTEITLTNKSTTLKRGTILF